MSQVINISLQENIVRFTTKHILKLNSTSTDFSSIAIIMPSKRPSLFIKKELSKEINTSYIPPKFFTYDELVKNISNDRGRKNISNIDSTYIIYNIVQQHLKLSKFGKYSYSSFFQWANEILNFINLLDLEKITSDKLNNIKELAKIGYYVSDNINELLKNLYFIREEYHKKLESLNKTTLAYSYYKAKEYVTQYLKDFNNIILFNPYYLNKSETEMFKAIFNDGNLDIIVRGNKNSWQSINKIYKDFNVSSKQVKDTITENIKFYNAYDGQSQACLVKNLIQKLPEKELESTVVIVPDNKILQSVASELHSTFKDINIAVGYPAQKTTIFSLMIDLVKTHLNRNDNNKYYVKDFISIISNPLVKNIRFIGLADVTRIIVHEIVNNFDISNKNAIFKLYQFISLDEIINCTLLHENISKKVSAYWQEVSPQKIKEIIVQLFTLFFYNIEKAVDMENFGTAIKDILQAIIDKSLISSYSFNISAVNIISDIANQFVKSICSKTIFEQREILKIFENMLSKGSINLVGSPLKGIQVLGFMESRGLSFDNVYVLSMTDLIVPSITEINPLIPKEVINVLNIGYIDREIDIQKYNFQSLIAGAKNVSLIYPNDAIRSRFIEDLIWKKQFKEKSLKCITVNNATIPTKTLTNNKPTFEKTDSIKQYLKNMSYSATSINTYIKCKLSFYYKYILKLEAQTDYDDDYESINIGNCIHDFLENFFTKGFKKEQLTQENKVLYFDMLDRTIDEFFKRDKTGNMYLLKKLIKTKLEDFYNNEQKRKFKEVLETEFDINSKIDVNGAQYNLKARIDRIDLNEDNTISIIDYKTGNLESPIAVTKYNDKEDEFSREVIAKDINSFQLIIYKYLYETICNKEVSNLFLYSLKNCETKELISQYAKDKYKVNYEILLKQLKYIIADINNDEPFRSEEYDNVECEKCPYFFLCR